MPTFKCVFVPSLPQQPLFTFFSKSYLSLILIPEYFKIGTTGVMCRIIDQTKKRRKEIQLKINTANKVWKCYTARNLKLKCWSICLKVKCLQAQGLSSATQVEKCFVLFWLLQFSGKIANLVNNGGWWKSFLLEKPHLWRSPLLLLSCSINARIKKIPVQLGWSQGFVWTGFLDHTAFSTNRKGHSD